MRRVGVGEGMRRDRRRGRTGDGQTIKVGGKLLSWIAILGVGMGGVAHGRAGVAGERDEGGVEGAGDVVEGDFHGRDVGGVASGGPSEDVATHATG